MPFQPGGGLPSGSLVGKICISKAKAMVKAMAKTRVRLLDAAGIVCAGSPSVQTAASKPTEDTQFQSLLMLLKSPVSIGIFDP